MGNMPYVTGFIFALTFITYFLGQFDRALCPEASSTFNTTTYENETKSTFETGKEIISHAGSLECSGVPAWVNIFIYVPLIAGLIYSVIPFK